MAYGLSFPRRHDGAGRQQRQRRRRLHRAQRRAVSRPHARPGGQHRATSGTSSIGIARRHPDPRCATSPTSAIGKELRTGAATENGQEVVLGTVFMLIGENSRTVSQRVAAQTEGDQPSTLPEGVIARTGLRPHAPRRQRRSRPFRRTCSKARCWSSSCCFSFLGNIRAAHHHRAASFRSRCCCTITGMVENEGQRQPDEPGRARLRAHRRRRRHHRRELPPPAGARRSTAKAGC